MALTVPMKVAVEFPNCGNQGRVEGSRKTGTGGQLRLWDSKLSSISLKQYPRSTNIPNRFLKRLYHLPCQCSRNIGPSSGTVVVKIGALNLARFTMECKNTLGTPAIVKAALAVGVSIFTIWGLGRVLHPSRNICQNKSDSGWKKSGAYHVTTSYILPLFLCVGVMFKCRTFDPVIPPTEAGQIVKQLPDFVGPISAGLKVIYIISCLESLAKKLGDPNDAIRSPSPFIQFLDRGWYCVLRTSVTLIFIEMLGFQVMNWNLHHVVVSVFSTLALLEIFERTRADESKLTLKGSAADIQNPFTAAEDASLDSHDGVSTQIKQDIERQASARAKHLRELGERISVLFAQYAEQFP